MARMDDDSSQASPAEPADDRLVLLRALVAIARADGEVAAVERQRLLQLAEFLRLDSVQTAEVEALLDPAHPAPELPRQDELPGYDVRLYVFQQALMMSYADGIVQDEERSVLDRLADTLDIEPAHRQVAWRRAEEMSGQD